MKIAEIERNLDVDLLFAGQEFLESKDYQSAWSAFNEYLTRYPDMKVLRMNLSFILLKTGRAEECLTECLKLLDHLEDSGVKRYAGLIYNQIAWTYLVLDNVTEADHFSALAIKAVPNDSNVAGTRGSVLVEKGLLNEGMSLLFSNMDFRFVNNATLSSAMYLMLAYALRRESKESDKYFRFVDENREKLEVDEKVLFERNRFRVQELTLSN